ncbi:hypothetical protein BJ165DRAFT_1457721 [Panaeolus papilionaceus]|nr:hypothetical protein BJ165DRAFT_1457721 [Panaeolus papilionaceus]
MSSQLKDFEVDRIQQLCKNQATLPVGYQDWFHCLTLQEAVGLTVISFAATLSVVSICLLAFAVFWKSRHYSWNMGLYEPLHILTLSLFIGDLLQAIGSLMSMHWISKEVVTVKDPFCLAQGWVQTVGETGAALSNLVLCIFTLISVFQQNLQSRLLRSRRLWFSIIATVWIVLLIVTGVGIKKHPQSDNSKPYIGPTPYWCWINDEYREWQIGNEYVWFWITLVFAVIVYAVAAFSSTNHSASWSDLKVWNWKPLESTKRLMRQIKSDSSSFSLALLWYPVIYALSILPLSIVRWRTFSHKKSSGSGPTMAVATIYALTGTYNVILLLLIRRLLAPPPAPSHPAQDAQADFPMYPQQGQAVQPPTPGPSFRRQSLSNGHSNA